MYSWSLQSLIDIGILNCLENHPYLVFSKEFSSGDVLNHQKNLLQNKTISVEYNGMFNFLSVCNKEIVYNLLSWSKAKQIVIFTESKYFYPNVPKRLLKNIFSCYINLLFIISNKFKDISVTHIVINNVSNNCAGNTKVDLILPKLFSFELVKYSQVFQRLHDMDLDVIWH